MGSTGRPPGGDGPRLLPFDESGRRYLAAGERLVLDTRRHPVVLAAPAIVAVAGAFLAGLLGWILSPDSPNGLVDTILGLVAVALVLRFGWRLSLWWVDRIVVTDRRVLEVSGILTRRVASMPLVKVTDMVYSRSLLGRVVGYGDMVFESAGHDQGLDHIERVPRPDRFYRTVTGLVASGGTAASHRSPPSGPPPSALPPSGPSPTPRSPEDEDTSPLPQARI